MADNSTLILSTDTTKPGARQSPNWLIPERFDNIIMDNYLQYIPNQLQTIKQVISKHSKPGTKVIIKVPYGSSDTAYTDLQMVNRYFLHSFNYLDKFGVSLRETLVYVPKWLTEGRTPEQVYELLGKERNVALYMECLLEVGKVDEVKPSVKLVYI